MRNRDVQRATEAVIWKQNKSNREKETTTEKKREKQDTQSERERTRNLATMWIFVTKTETEFEIDIAWQAPFNQTRTVGSMQHASNLPHAYQDRIPDMHLLVFTRLRSQLHE